MRYSLIALSQSQIHWGKPISVRFSRFNFENAWAYSWKQRWVFYWQASIEKFAVSDGESSGISNFYRAVIGARGCFSTDRIFQSFYSTKASRWSHVTTFDVWRKRDKRREITKLGRERGRSRFCYGNSEWLNYASVTGTKVALRTHQNSRE